MKNKLLMTAAFAVAATVASQAAVISDWSFANVTGLVPDADIAVGTTLIAAADNTVVTGIASTDLLSGGSLRYENASGTLGELNLKNFHITTGDGRGFFTFTLAADAGQAINVTDLTMSSYRNGAGAPTQLQWHVVVDGGTEEEYGAEQVGQTGGFATDTFTETITEANSVKFTFRLDNATGNGNIHFNDIQVNGSVVAIPEPATLGMVALFGGGILFIRRRFR